MKLEPNHEIVGDISNVHEENGFIKLTFSLQKEVDIPEDAISSEKLESLIGKRIGIFNCNGIYKIRIIRER